jgi:hypothetical protein
MPEVVEFGERQARLLTVSSLIQSTSIGMYDL